MAGDMNSLLVADIGSVHTRLVLIDLVEGQYRLIASARARTTAEPPLGNVSLGIDHAAQHMTALTGRELVDPESDKLLMTPENGGHGVDAFLVTSSAGRPMRVFLVGLTPEISIASGHRMLAGSYVSVTDVLSPDDLRSEEGKINAILTSEPDMILIVGGTDNGADKVVLAQVKVIEQALALIRRGTMPNVLFAGNEALRPMVKRLLDPYTEVFVAKNVRPNLRDEQIFPAQIEMALVFDEYRSRSPGGFAEIGRESQVGVVPTTQGYISTVRYMSEVQPPGLGPLFIDVGSANSVIAASVRKEPHYRIRTNLGMGHHAVNALKAVTPEKVKRWLPFDIADDDLWDYVYNKELRPAAIPGTPEELMIEQAIAREIVRVMVAELRPAWDVGGTSELLPDFQPITGAGAILTEAQHPGISAMILLDALQPSGAVELRLDPHNLVSALGVVAYVKPIITVQAFEAGGLINLGTAFCPLGRPRYGHTAMTVQVRQADGQILKQTVKGGEIWMAPVLPGLSTEVTIKLARGLTIDGKRRIRRRVVAGAAGIIFDARGRPLVMPGARDRVARLTEWQMAMMGRVRRPKAQEESEETAPAVETGVPMPSMGDLGVTGE
jgi:uncharacterized protein (TIGR01319 family)